MEPANDNATLLVAPLFVAIGLFCFFCAYKDYDWFMNNRKAKVLVKIFGRKGARIFYCLLGALIFSVGFVLSIGAVVILVS